MILARPAAFPATARTDAAGIYRCNDGVYCRFAGINSICEICEVCEFTGGKQADFSPYSSNSHDSTFPGPS